MKSLPDFVMLVDDDFDDHEIFSLALESVDPSIKCAYYDSAQIALNDIIQKNFTYPDYIFLDLNMPGLNGIQFLEQLKKEDCCTSVPIVVYSTSILPSDKEKVLNLGADHFFIKPSSHKELIAELNLVFKTIQKMPAPSST